jgi:ABC-2 type transport system ATP-binding protein
MLEIAGLTKAYRDRVVLDGVDLTAAAGRITGLVGANGAGKTTLISIAAGLRRPDRGTVRVAGIDAVRDRRRAARHIGLAPQALGLYPTLTVADNLRVFARLAGLRGGAVRRRGAEVAERLGLADRLGDRAATLSGGQQRRLHTGMAVLHRPDIMFLDEPTVGADVQSRAGILDVVRSMAADGAAIVYTTHYLTELEQLAADIAVLHNGRISVRGPLETVLAGHARATVTLRFHGPAPDVPGWTADGSSLTALGPVGDPGMTAARAVADLGPAASGLAGVEVNPASLESAYLAITGTRPGQELVDA